MFKWKVSGLGSVGSSKKNKSSNSTNQQGGKLNNHDANKAEIASVNEKNNKNKEQLQNQNSVKDSNGANKNGVKPNVNENNGSSYNKEEVNNTINEKSNTQNNTQKSSSGFRLFQSSSSNSNQNSNSGNTSKVENTSNVPQQQNNNPSSSQPPNSTTMSRQSNGIWKTVDKAAMNRVGQRLAMTTAPLPPKIQQTQQQQPPQQDFNGANSNEDHGQQNLNESSGALLNMTSEHIYASGNGGIESDMHNTSMPVIQYGKNKGPLPPPPLPQTMRPGWPGHPGGVSQDNQLKAQIPNSFSPNSNGQLRSKDGEEAIPNDSLYAGGYQHGQSMENNSNPKNGFASWRDKQFGSRPSLNGMAAWSSHGYLAKSANEGGPKHSPRNNNDANGIASNGLDSGYVMLKRQEDGQLVTVQSQNGPMNGNVPPQQSQSQPQSLPTIQQNQPPYPYPPQINQDNERKYFSVNNFRDAMAKHGPSNGATFEFSENFHNQQNNVDSTLVNKYHSVDPRYNSIKNLPPDLRMKLRETVRQKIDKKDAVNTYMVNNPDVQPPSYYKSPPYNTNAGQNAQGKNPQDFTNPYKQLPFNEAFYQQRQQNVASFPKGPTASTTVTQQHTSAVLATRPINSNGGNEHDQGYTQGTKSYQTGNRQSQQNEKDRTSNLQTSKKMSGSVSWLEWTQQLQAYIAWVNSQLRKRPDLKPVQDLRTDLQSGEVLAQLIEIISGEKIAGIQYAPESIQGMRENLERVLQFMATKRIRMHAITSREVLEGNLKSVMRLILALAAHYKPQSVRHHENSTIPPANTASSNNNHSPKNQSLNQTYENVTVSKSQTNDTSRKFEGSMMERTSFGMLKPSDTSSSSKPLSPTDVKPALPKRSPAPKQESNISTSFKEGDSVNNLEDRLGNAKISTTESSIPNRPNKVATPSSNSMVTSPPFMAVKRSPSMNDAHYSTVKYPALPSKPVNTTKQMSDKFSSRIAADKAAFFAEKQSSQQIYENVEKEHGVNNESSAKDGNLKQLTENKPINQISDRPLLQKEGSFVLQKEDSFIRTGSGRKLPKIPQRSLSANASGANPALPNAPKISEKTDGIVQSKDESKDEKEENQKCASERQSRKPSKPKALEFWETLANNDQPPSQPPAVDFRYNTIHRMSTGRRQLPKPPPKDRTASSSSEQGNNPLNHLRSQSLDRTMMDTSDSRIRTEGSSLNSSFASSENNHDADDLLDYDAANLMGLSSKPLPPDGCSLKSHEDTSRFDSSRLPFDRKLSQTSHKSATSPMASVAAKPGQPSPPSSSDTRGEVEGSSDNNSPPTSVITGEEHDTNAQKTRAYDWVRGTFNGASKEFLSHHQELNSDKFSPKFPSIPATGMSHQQIMRNRGYGGNIPDGNSHGGSSKHSDSMSDEVPPPHRLNKNGRVLDDSDMDGHIPYEVLMNDLTQAKRQLVDLQNLLLSNGDGRSSKNNDAIENGTDSGDDKILNGVVGSFEFDQCVEQINVLNLRLKNADDRANNLMADLRHVRKVCAEQHLNRHEHTNKLPPPPPPLLLSSSQILLNSDSPISESISLPPLVSIPNGSHRSSLARTVTQHLNITNGISFGRNSLFMEDENMKTIMARASLSSSSGANTPASSLHGGASSPTLPTSPSECTTMDTNTQSINGRVNEHDPSVGQLRQNLVRTTLAKQTLEYEKKELLRRIEELERGMPFTGGKNKNDIATSPSIPALLSVVGENEKRLRELISREKAGESTSDLKSMYDEELNVARDAISNLRTSFKGADPNQHILDTLEQCISVIIEKMQSVPEPEKGGSRLSSLDYSRTNEGLHNGSRTASQASTTPSTTKILYFTNRSVTPFMCSISKRIGDIRLSDFKALFDRPGFYRYHFKAVDQEFGMVKEEISMDDAILPGADGKVVAWVEED